MKTTILIACLVTLAVANYQNYKVYRVTAANKEQLDAVKAFENLKGYDFWSRARQLNKHMDIMVSPEMQAHFTGALKHSSVAHEVLIDDVETVLQRQTLQNMMTTRAKKGKISFDDYYTYAEIVDYLNQLEQDYPEIVNVTSIGKSSEGREIAVIKISTGSTNEGTNKPAILIDGSIHAREWISPATVLYFINQLVENSENHNMIKDVDWYIVPVLNPDGYEFSQTTSNNRFWQKTRSQGRVCKGVDANRNFDFHWLEVGASDDECDETYAGPKAFSEPESENLKNLVLGLGDQVKLYLTFHSHGTLLMYPWGYTSALPDDWQSLDALAHDVADAIKAVRGTDYTIGSSTNVLYPVAGGSADWVKAVGGVDFSFTIELPGGGTHGFNPPPIMIKGIVTETFEGLKVYHAFVQKNF